MTEFDLKKYIHKLENENLKLSKKYIQLHTDCQKLVCLAVIYGLNPNIIFYLDKNDLIKDMEAGVKVYPAEHWNKRPLDQEINEALTVKYRLAEIKAGL